MDRSDVVSTALTILGEVGLPDLTMRRLGTELGVQQSAIYHHFANKQALLGAVADEILARGPQGAASSQVWSEQVRSACSDVRAAVLAYADGADVVASMFAFGLGGAAPYERLLALLEGAGADPRVGTVAARTLLHYVYGHAVAQQAQEQAARLGAIEVDSAASDDFDLGLDLVIAGIGQSLGSA